PAAERVRADVGAGRRRPLVPAGPKLLFGEKLQPVDELRAGDLPSRRSNPGYAAFHPALPRLRTRADARRSPGGPDAADKGRLRHRRHRRPRRQRHHEGGEGLSDQDGAAACRRLWRAEGAGAVEAGQLGRVLPGRCDECEPGARDKTMAPPHGPTREIDSISGHCATIKQPEVCYSRIAASATSARQKPRACNRVAPTMEVEPIINAIQRAKELSDLSTLLREWRDDSGLSHLVYH